ncbi:MAG TPA: sigma-70 family RNA polymerase sigma factor [Pirellulales bacterium]|jgi:RNA polymerase sigma-70 factor (ECF subfamily)
MHQDDDFPLLLRRIRAGDDEAAELLVRRYEPLIRREVRLRIEDERLNRAFDSLDVSQSVLASFFVRAAIGEYDLDCADQLVRLLVAMARNKLASRARQERRLRRDVRRVAVVSPAVLSQVADPCPSASEMFSRRELLERMRGALADEERRIADLRGEGLSWDEVADRLGGSGQARRMQLSRGIERVGRELGLED